MILNVYPQSPSVVHHSQTMAIFLMLKKTERGHANTFFIMPFFCVEVTVGDCSSEEKNAHRGFPWNTLPGMYLIQGLFQQLFQMFSGQKCQLMCLDYQDCKGICDTCASMALFTSLQQAVCVYLLYSAKKCKQIKRTVFLKRKLGTILFGMQLSQQS